MLSAKEQKQTRPFNFNAGPAVLPESVLDQIQSELKSYQGSGVSILEMGHREKPFEAIIGGAEAKFRSLLGVSDNYEVLFIQGGARLQFSMIPMNLALAGKPVNVIHTGVWTEQAIAEIKKIADCRVVASGEEGKFSSLPKIETGSLDAKASYVHMCSNNTIYGTQWKQYPNLGDIPLVVDMTSDILSRRFNPDKLGIFFASAQKNLGIAGVTVVCIRKDLMERCNPKTPTMLQYREYAKAKSLINTAPTFAIYVADLVMGWIQSEGGLDKIEVRNRQKSKLVYDFIDSGSFYRGAAQRDDRSIMNIVFRIGDGNQELEAHFVNQANEAGLVGLKGHRSVGGLRASIYNAQPVEGVEALISFMREFEKKNG